VKHICAQIDSVIIVGKYILRFEFCFLSLPDLIGQSRINPLSMKELDYPVEPGNDNFIWTGMTEAGN